MYSKFGNINLNIRGLCLVLNIIINIRCSLSLYLMRGSTQEKYLETKAQDIRRSEGRRALTSHMSCRSCSISGIAGQMEKVSLSRVEDISITSLHIQSLPSKVTVALGAGTVGLAAQTGKTLTTSESEGKVCRRLFVQIKSKMIFCRTIR